MNSFIGEAFQSMQEIRDKLKIFALENNCPYYLKYSSQNRLDAKCPSTRPQAVENAIPCGFRVTAYRGQDGHVCIRTQVLQHSIYCTEIATPSSYAVKELTSTVLANVDKVRPRDMVNLVRNIHGATPTYKTAWNALNKEKIAETLEGNKSFSLMKCFMIAVEEANPGSTTSLECSPDRTFKRAFICPYAAQMAFKHCRPMVILDACHIKSNYGGVILSACARGG